MKTLGLFITAILIIFPQISQAQNIELVGSCDLPGWGRHVLVSGNYAYIANYNNGLQIINIGDPTNPFLAGYYNTPEQAYGVGISGEYAFVTIGYTGLQVIDIYDHSNPVLAGGCDTPGYSYDITIYENYAFIDDVNSGLQVMDISNPINPNIIGSYNRQSGAPNIFVSGVYAYFTENYYNGEENMGRFQVLNISDPTLPAYWGASSYIHSIGFKDIAVNGTYAYVLGSNYLLIFNIEDHSNPQFFLWAVILNDPHSLIISDYYAYVADGDSGLKIIDISDPSNPSLVSGYDTQNVAWDIYVANNYIYLIDYYDSSPRHSTFSILHFNPIGIDEDNSTPSKFSLSQSFPNPFNAQTTISYNLPTASAINLDIYDILGRHISTLVNESQVAGPHAIIWNAENSPSGTYFYCVKAGEKTETNRMLLLK